MYDQENYNVTEITTSGSKGETYFKRIKYNNAFYSYAGIFSQLYDKNILTAPVSTTTGFYTNNGSETYYLDNTITEYTSVANGDIKPYRTLVARTNQPQTSTSWFSYENPASSDNSINYKETQLLTYDATGNLIGIKDEGNHFVSNIYNYNDKYVVASVINAHPWVDKPAYTSFEAQNTGNWTLNGSPNYVTSSSVTGTTSYNLSSSSLVAPVNTNKPYKLSLWATNTVSVNGNASLLKSGPVINGFTYYEYNITAGSSSVSVSGNAIIDELRVYPIAARMRTVTYDPLIGKTSECDENNRITFYEYDELGRLRFIKDENKNITKMYEYNTTNKPGGCPATYNNLAISEVFTKNDCPAGFIGSKVTYTIQANGYSSTISQADADQKAEDELNRYGQANANTHGSCIQLFYNVALSQSFNIQSCPTGYAGGTYTYSVAAGTYTSTVSQADADEMAQDEIDANGQTYANLPANAICNIDTSPEWWSTGIEQCQTDGNGNLTGHQLLQQKDKNPNSSSYNQLQWADMGANTAACLPSTCNNCNGTTQKCINSTCETGYKVYTYSYQLGNGQYECTYHYEYSDGSWSYENYTEISNYPCPIN